MAVDDNMVQATLDRGKLHVYNVCQSGGIITLIKPGTKDELGEIMTEVTQELHSFPTRFTPFDNETIRKIAWSENVNVIFYIAKKEIEDLSLTIEHIKQYIKVRFNGKQYEIAYVENYSNFANDFLYVIIGAKL